jgi:tight adherence protein B
MISAEPLIYIAIFASVIFVVQGIYLMLFGKSITMNGKVNRRLKLLEKGGNREKVLEQLRKEMTQHIKSQSIPLYSILYSDSCGSRNWCLDAWV